MDDTPARFGSDHGALRSEDMPLLVGRGRFTDDLNAPDQAYAVFLRAPVSHANIRAVDTERRTGDAGRARHLHRTGYYRRRPRRDSAGRRHHRTRRQADGRRGHAGAGELDRIRYVGEPVAIVVARTLAQAQDAVEQIKLDIEELAAPPPTSIARRPKAHRSFMRKRPATSRSTGPTATPRPSTRRSRPPRMSSACG